MKAVVAAFNQEKALVGAFSVITNLRMELLQALLQVPRQEHVRDGGESRGGAAGGVPAPHRGGARHHDRGAGRGAGAAVLRHGGPAPHHLMAQERHPGDWSSSCFHCVWL